jgi:type II secretory pathway component PulJ
VVRRQAGVTLVELLVGLAVMALFLVLSAVLVTVIMKQIALTKIEKVLQGEGRLAIEQIGREIHEGSAAGIVVDTPGGQPPNSRIKIPMPNGATDIFFLQDGKNLLREDNNGVIRQILSENLRQLGFSYANPSNKRFITVSIVLEKGFGKKHVITRHFSSENMEVLNP